MIYYSPESCVKSRLKPNQLTPHIEFILPESLLCHSELPVFKGSAVGDGRQDSGSWKKPKLQDCSLCGFLRGCRVYFQQFLVVDLLFVDKIPPVENNFPVFAPRSSYLHTKEMRSHILLSLPGASENLHSEPPQTRCVNSFLSKPHRRKVRNSLSLNLDAIFRAHPGVIVKTSLTISCVLSHFIMEITCRDGGTSQHLNEEIELSRK